MNRTNYFFRHFDPLKPIKNKNISCVLHIAAYVEVGVRDSDSNGDLEDFITVRKCIEHVSNQIISKQKYFKLYLIVSINGNIENEKYIQYFKSIDKKRLSDTVYCKVFQRPNIGYQWGGFHDVWLRYKDSNCQWYVSMESDYKIIENCWFDKITYELLKNKNFGNFGSYQKPRDVFPDEIMSVCVPDRAWCDGNGSIYHGITKEELIHTAGSFYFCKRELLEKLDNVYGCFTYSTGCNHNVDGVIQGEIGFCQKIRAIGYETISTPTEDIVKPLRGFNRMENEFNQICIEMDEFKKG